MDIVGHNLEQLIAVFQFIVCSYPSNENWPFVEGLQSCAQNVNKIGLLSNKMKIYLLVVIPGPNFFMCDHSYLRILASIFYTYEGVYV